MLAQLRALTRRLAFVPFYRGQMIELAGFDPEPVMRAGPAHGKLTSIVVISFDALEQTVACLARLRETQDPDHPTEILFVDNGSQDGSAEFLAAQPDVQLLRNESNLGAPHARNQALPFARGEYVVFLDNDAMVTPDWLARLLYHAEVDPRSGCIAPTSDRAAHGQQLAMSCADDPVSIAQFARRISADLERQHFRAAVLSSFCLLVPRRVLDAIGGFDERFSPWGYEDDDFTLRATLAGFSNRCARDVFVRHEAYAGRNKSERHAELLTENWRRFAHKWGLDEDERDKNDARLAPILQRQWPSAHLRIPIDTSAGQLPLLPQQTTPNTMSPRP
jgi:GT2 family glycosyltransferase